jgi:hypothetical protein
MRDLQAKIGQLTGVGQFLFPNWVNFSSTDASGGNCYGSTLRSPVPGLA